MQNFPLNLLTLPYWWYTVGAGLVFQWNRRQLRYTISKTGLLMLVRHIREPLYKDYTRTGIIFSFFLRIVLIIFKAAIVFLKALYLLILDLLYLFLLPGVMVMIIIQLLPPK